MSALAHGLNDVYLQPNSQVPTQDLSRTGPQRQGANIFHIAQAILLFEQTREELRRDIEQLKISYVFADHSVTRFLLGHRSFVSLLIDAIEPLREFFGSDKIFRLEVSTDEDEVRALYVVVRWTGATLEASTAIDRFDDEWWLDHMTPAVSNLSFTYDFA